jgi:tripartite-type tricarboxylate transporter receptor subunit TctC
LPYGEVQSRVPDERQYCRPPAAPSLLPAIPYDTARDLAPIRQLVWTSNILVVRGDSPVQSLAERIAAAKARPQSLTYASGGNGTPAHLAGELFKLRAGIDIPHVPYKGAVAGVTAVMGEQVDFMFATAPAVAGHITSGKLRALATAAPKTIDGFPDVPTMAELGVADFDVRDWQGIVVPTATLTRVMERVAMEVGKVLARPEVGDRLIAVGMEPVADATPEDFRHLIRAELARWANIVRQAGIRAD